jgi:predicted transcriptional regulator
MCDTEADSPLADSHDDLSQLFKDPDSTSQEVVRSVFDLKHVETRAYLALLERPHSSAQELADRLDRHRRHVARALRGLHDAGLVERERETFDTGGFGYAYDPVPADEAQQYLQEQLDEWVAHLRCEIADFDDHIESRIASDGGSDECSHEDEY